MESTDVQGSFGSKHSNMFFLILLSPSRLGSEFGMQYVIIKYYNRIPVSTSRERVKTDVLIFSGLAHTQIYQVPVMCQVLLHGRDIL